MSTAPTGEIYAKQFRDLERDAKDDAAKHEKRARSLYRWGNGLTPLHRGLLALGVTGGGVGAVIGALLTKPAWGALVGVLLGGLTALIAPDELLKRAHNAEDRKGESRQIARDTGGWLPRLREITSAEAHDEYNKLSERLAANEKRVPK